MAFWLAVLGGALFVRVAVDIGFYQIWAMFFNIVISIYVAVLLTPIITDLVPAAGETSYGHVLTLAAAVVGTFLILYAISYTCLTSQSRVSFPKVVEVLFAGLLGFLAGFLAFSFGAFLICLTPISEHPLVNKFRLNTQSQQANISYICWWCDLVNTVAASRDNGLTGRQAIDKLLKSAQSVQPITGEQPEPGQPVESHDPAASASEEGPVPPQPGTNPGDT
jgi:hypothetical protein